MPSFPVIGQVFVVYPISRYFPHFLEFCFVHLALEIALLILKTVGLRSFGTAHTFLFGNLSIEVVVQELTLTN